MDNHRNSFHPLAAWFPGWEHQPKISTDWELDSHSDRDRGHPGYSEPSAYHIEPCFDDQTGSVEAGEGFSF